MNFFSDEMRRNPYGVYEQMRSSSPAFQIPPPFDAWLIFDYEGVKRVLSDHEAFSSAVPAPRNWFIFLDPPQHTKLRALISRAFTPRMVANLELEISQLSRELLAQARIALTDLLTLSDGFELVSNEPWKPRQALHVHGPAKLDLRFRR